MDLGAEPGTVPDLRSHHIAGAESRAYWLYQLSGWGSLTVIAVLSSAGGNWETALSFAYGKTLCMLTGFGLSHFWRLYLRRNGWLHRNAAFPFRPILAGLLLLSLLQTGFLFLVDLVFRHGSLLLIPEELPILVIGILTLWFSVFAVWTLWYAVVLSRRRALRFELEKLELELSIKDAELRALQAQINPHFFFNSLNSIRALIYQDAECAAQAVGQLAGMMRHSLLSGQQDTVRLCDELAAVEAYLGMEKLRFEDRLQLEMAIAPGLDAIRLPPMALQALVENAVKHGVEPGIGVCQVRICALRADGHVQLTVANQGRLAQASASTRLGLRNTGQRLALLLGPGATCSLTERDGWVNATIVLPQEHA